MTDCACVCPRDLGVAQNEENTDCNSFADGLLDLHSG